MSGYSFLALAVLCFCGLGLLHKVADFQKCRPSAINAYLFFWACLFTAVYTLSLGSSLKAPAAVTGVAVFCGLCASVAILAFQMGIRFGNISTSWLIINLSTGVPTMLSIVIYREAVGLRRGIALVAIVLSLIFLWRDRQLQTCEKARVAHESKK
jgi:EamA domain-containing membrane protein RarD